MHCARIRGTREEVVIKVLKPGIEDILVADLNFVYVVARILEFLSPDLSRASLVRYSCVALFYILSLIWFSLFPYL